MKGLLLNFRIFFSLILLSILISLIDSLNYLDSIKSLAQVVTLPIQYGVYKSTSGVGKQVNTLLASRTAAQENTALKQQLAILLSENSQLVSQLKEFKALDIQAKTPLAETFDLLPAKIITAGRYLTIDKGTLDEVKLGQVVVYKDSFIGQVRAASPHSSQIILPGDPDFKISVFSQNIDGKAKGIVSGEFGSKITMDKILHQENIKVGDLVYSEGIEGSVPKGLIMGRVIKVIENQSEVFKSAEIEPLFETADLDIIFILKIQ